MSMHSFIVAIINGSYMFQQQSSQHQAVYVISIHGNYIAVVYIWLKMMCGRYLSLTYRYTQLSHINKYLQHKNIV